MDVFQNVFQNGRRCSPGLPEPSAWGRLLCWPERPAPGARPAARPSHSDVRPLARLPVMPPVRVPHELKTEPSLGLETCVQGHRKV